MEDLILFLDLTFINEPSPFKVITKPIKASPIEIKNNSRARSEIKSSSINIMNKVLYILQLKLGKDKKSVRSNLWKLSVLLFFMAFISVYSSFSFDKKLLKKHENDKCIEQLKSSFVANKKVNDLKIDLLNIAMQEPFKFMPPNRNDIIIIQSE